VSHSLGKINSKGAEKRKEKTRKDTTDSEGEEVFELPKNLSAG